MFLACTEEYFFPESASRGDQDFFAERYVRKVYGPRMRIRRITIHGLVVSDRGECLYRIIVRVHFTAPPR